MSTGNNVDKVKKKTKQYKNTHKKISKNRSGEHPKVQLRYLTTVPRKT